MAAAADAILPLFLAAALLSAAAAPSPYLSPTTLPQSYQNMLSNLKIFIYKPYAPFEFPDVPASLFFNSLRRSSFITQIPDEAHLFFVPFSPDTSTRSMGRVVRELRTELPYWNRTLGADHFFLSPAGIDYSSDRNILELKKNSVQIAVFPVVSGNFVPHKDVTLPPPSTASPLALIENSTRASILGVLLWDGKTELDLVNELKLDPDFVIEEKLERSESSRRFSESKFCLFLHRGGGEAAGMVEAMAAGCVPVVVVDRPVQDLPLMDVLRWSDLALVVHGGAAGRLKQILLEVSEEKLAEMREMVVAASKHLVWNEEARAEEMDAFNMVLYQLWLRRHAVRYARR